MTDRAPYLFVYARPDDRTPVAQMHERLAPRGVAVFVADPAATDAETLAARTGARLCLVVLSPNALRDPALASAVADLQSRGQTVVALLTDPRQQMPEPFRALPWLDGSGTFTRYWGNLLTLLDDYGLSHVPLVELDHEVIHARLRTGAFPPNWRVFRRLERGRAFRWDVPWRVGLTASYVVASALAAYFTTLGWPLRLVIALAGAELAYRQIREKRLTWRTRGTGEMYLITPLGCALVYYRHNRTRRRDVRFYAFAGITELRVQPPLPGKSPIVRFMRGETTVRAMPLIPAFGGSHVLAATQAQFAAYQAQGGTSQKQAPIFISAAPADGTHADEMEVLLRDRHGLPTWLDRSQSAQMTEPSPTRDAVVASAAALLVLASPAAWRSPTVLRDCQVASASGIPIILYQVRTGGQPPAEVRPTQTIEGGAESSGRAVNALFGALVEMGLIIHPSVVERYRVLFEQVLSGKIPPEVSVQRARGYPVPTQYYLGILPVLLAAAGLIWLDLAAGLWLLYLFVAGWGSTLLYLRAQSRTMPHFFAIAPDFFVLPWTGTQGNLVQNYGTIVSVESQRAWFPYRGTQLKIHLTNGTVAPVTLPATLPDHAARLREIMAGWERYKAEQLGQTRE